MRASLPEEPSPRDACLTAVETFSSGSAGDSSCWQARRTWHGSVSPLLLAVRGHGAQGTTSWGRIPPARSVPGWSPEGPAPNQHHGHIQLFHSVGHPSCAQHLSSAQAATRRHTHCRDLQALLFPVEARNATEKQNLFRFQSCTTECFFQTQKLSLAPSPAHVRLPG